MRGAEFNELKSFLAIVDHGSFARAAGELGVSRSALSQTIRAMEERVGVRLLNRTTRSVAPTAAGARLFEQLRPAVQSIERAMGELRTRSDEPAGQLRINLPRVAAHYLIAPLLGQFCRAYPGIQLELTIDDAMTDIVAQRFDAGIRLSERLHKDMVAVPIGGELELAAAAAPSYLAERGTPETPRDLHNHDCINFRLFSSAALYRWEFEKGTRSVDVSVSGNLIVNDPEVALQAAADGVGIVYLLSQQVSPWLQNGRLVRILEPWSPRFSGFHLYYPGRRQMTPPLRAFIDFVRSKLNANTKRA
jgi:DNA-binding transcriptional LysR family regulator